MAIFQELGELPDFELPDVLPDLPGVAQNLAFVTDLSELPDVPFFDVGGGGGKSGNSLVSSEAAGFLQHPEVLPRVESTPPLPPTEAPPDLPPLSVDQPDLSSLPDPEPFVQLDPPMASKPVQAKSSDEPGLTLSDHISSP